eukprot:7099562-Prymnesium_polylepis.2
MRGGALGVAQWPTGRRVRRDHGILVHDPCLVPPIGDATPCGAAQAKARSCLGVSAVRGVLLQ